MDAKKLFTLAIASFEVCINDSENHFLNDEIDTEISDLIINKRSIKCSYLNNNLNDSNFEIELYLNDEKNNLIGKYILIVSEEYKAIEDSLIFW